MKYLTAVRDFSQIFDSYGQFEESIINAKMVSLQFDQTDEDIDLRLARFERLMDRKPLLMNSVLLRQNPHDVDEWHERIKLLDGNPFEIINCYTEAVEKVDAKLAKGKAVRAPYVKVDDLAAVWCGWAETELKRGNHEAALQLMRRATTQIDYRANERGTIQMGLNKSLKIWSMYVDLEQNFGTFKSCKAVYDQILDLRIATPQIIINMGSFLEENGYFEEAFKAYEKGIAIFKWPIVYGIWTTYLTKFIDRFGGRKLERARGLLEECLADCPASFTKNFYLLYAKFEEERGLASRAMAVYDRATRAVLPEEMLDVFNIYVGKAAEIYGVARTCEIYEKAIEVLPDDRARAVCCLRFADLERKLGDVDRARAIYAYCSKICDPRMTNEFWCTWKEFEVRYGNEDTLREMLRIKRSVQVTYNAQNMNYRVLSAQMLAASSNQTRNPEEIIIE